MSGIVQNVVLLMVHFGAMWGCYGLCDASGACAAAKPWTHGLLLVRARQHEPQARLACEGGRSTDVHPAPSNTRFTFHMHTPRYFQVPVDPP